jgi:hypothetical protein
MKVLYENTNMNTKGNKKFTLSVIKHTDTHYDVTQKTYRVFSDGEETVQYEKTTTFGSRCALLEGEFAKSRQGKMFVEALTKQQTGEV